MRDFPRDRALVHIGNRGDVVDGQVAVALAGVAVAAVDSLLDL